MKPFYIFVATAFFLAACGNNKPAETKSGLAHSAPVEEVIVADHPGKKVYDSVCLACHQSDGSGVPGMHPPIIKSKYVNGDPDELIKIMLEGLSGKIEVNGEIYNGLMPPHAHLSNKQIADVLNYSRTNFGNNAGEITVEQVQNLRDKQ